MKGGKYLQKSKISVIWIFILLFIYICNAISQDNSFQPAGPASSDTVDLKYPFKDDIRFPFSHSGISSPLIMGNPSNIDATIVYDPETRQYVFSEKVGELNIRPQSSMTLDEYREYESATAIKDYWKQKSREEITAMAPSFMGKIRMGETFDKVFGTDAINIVPQGSA